MSIKQSLKLMGAAAVVFAGTTVFTTNAFADCEPEPYIGSICITAATFCPEPYKTLGDQQLYPIAQYQTLYSVIGGTFGGDWRTYFGLPQTAGRVLRSEGAGPGLIPIQAGQIFGSTHTNLIEENLPTHTHQAAYYPAGISGASLEVSTENGTKSTPATGDYIAVSVLGSTQSKSFIASNQAGPTVGLGGNTPESNPPESQEIPLSDAGASAPIPVSPPQLALRFCIAMDGEYPLRP